MSAYSYSRLVRTGAMKQIEVIAAAKEAGFDVIEFSTIAVPEGKTLPGSAEELRKEAVAWACRLPTTPSPPTS